MQEANKSGAGVTRRHDSRHQQAGVHFDDRTRVLAQIGATREKRMEEQELW
jgi:hypothetical protein